MQLIPWLLSFPERFRSTAIRRTRNQSRQDVAGLPRSAELLEDRVLPAANLQFISARLVDGTFADAPNPIVGEQLGVLVTWRTEDLPANTSYQIDVTVNGLPVSRDIDFGHGQSGTGQFFATFVGNFARSGTHTVNIALDVANAIAESNEADNTGSFSFTTDSTPNLQQKLIFPLGGESGRDWVIGNYLDVDPRPNVAADYRGGPYQYEGHPGIDASPANFAGIDRGIPVLAAADGVIVNVQDGHPDRESGFSNVNIPANFVTIDHGNDWQIRYFHLNRDSITVQPGDTVSQGQILALMGSSGASAGLIGGPHLHYDVAHNGRVVETFIAPNEYYIDPLPYQADAAPTVLDAVVTNYSAFGSPDPGERMSALSEFSTTENDTAFLTYFFSHLNDGDQITAHWKRPDGTVAETDGFTQSGDRRSGTHQWTMDDLIWKQQTGTWTVDISLAGTLQYTTSFEVVPGASAPEIRVRENGNIVLDGRTTPYDFGDVASGDAPPTMTFAIENHGGSDLTLGAPVLADGFSLVGVFPSTVAADASASFTVQLDTTTVGHKLGEIRFATNDADESSFDFPVEGTVTGTPPAGTPTIALNDARGVAAFAGFSPTRIQPDVAINDADAASWDSATLAVRQVAGGTPEDAIGLQYQGSRAGQVSYSNESVFVSGISVGSTGGSTADSLLVTFNPNADAAAVEAVARSVVWDTDNVNSGAPRTLEVVVTDVDGHSSEAAYREIVVGNRQTIVVTNTMDSGPGTLRQAIQDANAAIGPVTISFAIPDTDSGFVDVDSALPGGDADPDVFRITPASALPAIENSAGHRVLLNGSAQAATTGDSNPLGPEIELDGTQISGQTSGQTGLKLTSDGIELRGLIVSRFSNFGTGILIEGDDAVLVSSFVGPSGAGASTSANSTGVRISGDNATIGGNEAGLRNVISSNVRGVHDSGSGTRILGNYIGTDPTGQAAVPNTFRSLQLIGDNTVVGGLGAGNVISGNSGPVLLALIENAVISGNQIGFAADGISPLGNSDSGIVIQSDGLTVSSDIQIGGEQAGAENHIAHNDGAGVEFDGSFAHRVSISENSIHSNSRPRHQPERKPNEQRCRG